MGFSLVLDILVAGLLVVTISYAVMLNRRLRIMRQDKAELEKLATKFADATVRADDSITKLRATADDLKGQIEKAQGLRDDLAFLVERGGGTADRLEQTIRTARKEAPPTAAPKPVRKEVERGGSEEGVKTDAESELIRALRSAR